MKFKKGIKKCSKFISILQKWPPNFNSITYIFYTNRILKRCWVICFRVLKSDCSTRFTKCQFLILFFRTFLNPAFKVLFKWNSKKLQYVHVSRKFACFLVENKVQHYICPWHLEENKQFNGFIIAITNNSK